MSQWFITGTDTGAGKTSIAVSLLLAARDANKTAIAHKAIETGCDEIGRGPDIVRLAEAAQSPYSYSYTFTPPIAPAHAADLSGQSICVETICQHIDELKNKTELFFVEGAGGFLVPISKTETIADLATQCALPLIIVAPNCLGTINHTLLTIEAARQRNLSIAAVVLNDIIENDDAQILGNSEQIEQHGHIDVIRFPHCQDDDKLLDAGKHLLRTLLTYTES